MMDWTPPPPLACSLTPIHAPTPRYAAMLATCFVLTVVGVPGQLSAQTVEDTETRPNILVFVSDDMGWGQPGFNGGTEVTTPNMDRLADEGVKLTQFYVQPVCAPTRASLFTGRYAWKTGMADNPDKRKDDGLLLDERTIAEALRDSSYATWLVGKWQAGYWGSERLPLQRGFDHHYGFYNGFIDSYKHVRPWKGWHEILDWHRNGRPVVESGYSTFLLAEEASQLIERHDGSRPFFLYVAFNAAHDPYQAPPEYIAQFSHLPYDLETRKQRAMVKAMDDAIGQVMDALERRGVLDETLVMFLNDNGGASEAGGNSPYRGLKRSYLEGGIRVPAVMRWPSRITAGSASDALMHVADLFPTFAGLAGADTGGGLPLDGLDVWEAIANGAESPREEVVHSLDVIRVGDWKLLEEDGEFAKGDKYSPLQLYNIAEDPYETTNLASSETARVAELRERLVYHRPFARDAEPGAPIPGLDSIDSTDDRPVMFGEEENTAFGTAIQTALTQREAGNLGPALLRLEAPGTSLKLIYNETLDAASVPPADAFTVVVNPGYDSADVTDVGVSESEVVLTLAQAVAGGNTVGLTYDVPDTGAIQDTDSLEAVGITWVTATVSITDDDLPAVTVSFEQAIYTVPEGGNVTVKVKLSADPERDVTLTITKTNQDETSDSDYSPVPDTIMIADGDTEASFAFSATQDAIDDDGEKVKLDFGDLPTGVTASGTTEATVSITDDDVSPVITTNTASTILVEENETAVATLAATDADRPAEDLTWRITGGADRNGFRLTADGVLTFAAPQDYEAPDDSDGNGDYEVTVEVSDGTNPVEAVFTVRLEDVDDTAPALSSAVVNGATLTLTYGEALDGDSTPAADDFTVKVADIERLLTQVLVGGSTVTLTLVSEVTPGEAVTVSYTAGTRPIQDAAGNAAEDLTEYTVGTPPPPPPPPPPPITGGGGPRTSAPDAPRNLLADATDGAVTLMWEAPEDDGGAVITDYEYRIDQRGDWISIGSTATTHTIAGLVNGTTYVFQVRAVNRIGRSQPSDPVEATPIAQVFLDLAHFANGAGIISEVVLVNVAPHPIRPALYFYDQEGEPIAAESMVDVLGDLGIQEDGGLTIRTEMEPLGELTISTHSRGDLVSGSVKVAAYGAIGGVLRFDLPGIGVAGVQVSQPLRDAIFPVRRREGGIATGMALHNREEEAAVVSCRLMKNGAVLEEVEITLAANGQVARFIGEVFTGTDTSDFVGLVRCTAEGVAQFTGMALELDAGNRIFTTLPVVKVNRGRAGEAALDFAHFANGASIVSEMVFMNLETQPSGPPPTPFHQAIPPTRPVIYFYDQEGNPIDPALLVDLTGDLEITEDGALSIQSEMEPLGELTISTHGRGELVSGSVRVVSDGPIGGVLRFDLTGIGVAGVGASQPVRDALFPARRQADGISTAAAIHNLGEEALVVGCQLMKDGAVLEEEEIPLEANGQEARYIEEMFTSTDTSDFVGSVRCTAPEGEGMFTGVAVELDASNQIFTTLPVVPVPERMSQE